MSIDRASLGSKSRAAPRRIGGGLGGRLGSGDGGRNERSRVAAEQLGQPLEVGLEHVEHPRRVERGRRVEDREEQHAGAAEDDLLLAAVHLA